MRVEHLAGDPASRAAFTALYRARIAPEDQADPRLVLQWLDRPDRLLTSWTLAPGRSGTQHALLGAHADGGMVGIATLAFVPAARLAFIPYVAVSTDSPRAVLRALLHALARGLESLSPDGAWIVFELSTPGVRESGARLRLFRRSLAELGYGCGVLALPYAVPGLGGDAPPRPASLVLARRHWQPQAIDRALAQVLMRAVLRDVYADALGDIRPGDDLARETGIGVAMDAAGGGRPPSGGDAIAVLP